MNLSSLFYLKFGVSVSVYDKADRYLMAARFPSPPSCPLFLLLS
jgi:hypothetical protein